MARLFAGIVLLVAGAALRAPGLLVVGVMLVLVDLLRSLWSRRGLRELSYERRLETDRAAWGDEILLELTVRNRKLLPVPWLRVEDLVSARAVVDGHRLEPSTVPGYAILDSTWSAGWFQRITRRVRIVADRRGVYDFLSVRLRVADLFASGGASRDVPLPDRYRVVPRSVPVRAAVSSSLLSGPNRTLRGLFEEPSLFSGVRPYQPGDRLRRIHWKATARQGRPLSRRYDPAREREALIALDMQTVDGPYWQLAYDDDLAEGLCVAAISLARSLLSEGVACGLAVNAYSGRPQRTLLVAPNAAGDQLARLADGLAAVSSFASLPFEVLLTRLPRRMASGCSVVVLSARDPAPFLPPLRRLSQQGFAVRLAAYGPAAGSAAARARSVGISSSILALHPDWRTADALDLVA